MKRPPKYRNKPTVVEGVRFASQKEARRDAELQLLVRAGEISELKRQPRYRIIVNDQVICSYVGDWQYMENGQLVVEDAKGVQTPEFKLKFKLTKALWPSIDWRIS